MNALDYFLKYVKIETTSDENSLTCPSSVKELNLASEIVADTKDLGYESELDENGYVYLHLKANTKNFQAFGLCCHMDTSPDASGKNVKPQIIPSWDGRDLKLNPIITLNTTNYPALKAVIGDDLVITDGSTLLGADDKAGIAQVMGLLVYLKDHPEVEHGDVYICFTPDEEIGRGVDKLNYAKFPVKYAYTIDGGAVGSIEYENFNAASAKVTFIGKSIHPGSAKNKLVNASEVAFEFHSLLDKFQKPENTSGYEGFNHLTNMSGQVEKAKLSYIIRNHDRHLFQKQKDSFQKISKYLNDKYGYKVVNLVLTDSYYNMWDLIKEDFQVVGKAVKAIESTHIGAWAEAIRGGTDGSRLTYEGILTPNLGTGGYNFHSRAEVLSINQLHKGVEILVALLKQYLN
ncbi:MAG: peptidase T [Acholeplasmatales bacterium]|jgi:tripeptide aminopeptidase|nr:peptidase T [Acholeplasmatales bacterium]